MCGNATADLGNGDIGVLGSGPGVDHDGLE
jgi:hypothetical protein